MKKVFLFGSLAAMTVFTACDKNNNDNNNNSNSTDQMFVTQVAIGNNAEIQAGQLAATKATNADVKSFGQMMATEHSQAQADLKTSASSAGFTVSDSVDAEHRALMTRLSTLSGLAFDTAYMHSQVNDHLKTLTIFQMENYSGSNQAIRNYASQYLPHIQMHLQKADSISRRLQ
jgi:putative membrane protein